MSNPWDIDIEMDDGQDAGDIARGEIMDEVEAYNAPDTNDYTLDDDDNDPYNR